MKKKLYLTLFFFIGFFSLIIQTIFFREFFTVYYGNEFILSIVIFIYLFSVSAGIFLYKNLSDQIKEYYFIYNLLIFALIAFVLINMRSISSVKFITNIDKLSLFPIMQIIYSIFLIIFPTCLITGFLIPFSININYNINKVKTVNQVFSFGSLGAFFGGILFSLLFIKFFNNIEIILGIGLMIAILLLFINLFEKRNFIYLSTNFIAIVLLIAGLFFSNAIYSNLNDNKWKSFANDMKLLKTKDSSQNNITLGFKDDLYNIFLNEKLYAVFPDPIDDCYLAHISLIQHKNPETLLAIGFPRKKFITEAFKHGLKSIDFVEYDKEIIYLTKEYNDINFNNVNIIHKDPKDYIKNCRKKYDVVIFLNSEPYTISFNRIYTLESIKNINKILKNDGIFVSLITGDYYFLANESFLYNKVHLNTLKKIFKYAYMIPGDKIYFLCSQSNSQICFDPDDIIKRYKDRKISSDFFEKNYYYEILKKEKLKDFDEKMNASPIKIKNKDSRPVIYFYNTFLFSSFDYTKNPVFQNFLLKQYSAAIIFFFIIIIFLLIFLQKKYKPEKIILSASFSFMCIILLILFCFQNITGQLYSNFSLFNGLFMLGIFIGSCFSRKADMKNKNIPIILNILITTTILITGLNIYLVSLINNTFIIYSILFLLMTSCGIVAGFNLTYCININSDSKKYFLSNLYKFGSIDSFIASIVAFLWSFSILPILGNGLLIVLLVLINVISFIFLLK